MGRSVSTPTTTELVTYQVWYQPDPDFISEMIAEFGYPDDWYPEPGPEDFTDYLMSLESYARELWPSLTPCDVWLGNENRAILENDLVYFGVSEYCGMAAIWVASKGQYWSDTFDRVAFAQAWCRTIAPKFQDAFGEYDRLGGLGDGTSVYVKRHAA